MSMPDDPFQGEEWNNFANKALNGLLPMMQDSTVIMSFVPKGPSDVKFALELGFAIMLDKPIIAVIAPGTKVPAKMVAIADHIVEFDMSTEDVSGLTARLRPILDSLSGGDDD